MDWQQLQARLSLLLPLLLLLLLLGWKMFICKERANTGL